MNINYKQLRDIAKKVRLDMSIKGEIDLSRKKIRKKPRNREDLEILFIMAIEKMNKYKPYKKNSKIFLPYFYYEKN